MKKNYPVLLGLLGLILVGAAVLQISVLTYPPYAPESVPIQPTEYRQVELPTVERFRSPHVIFVLDISGSMKTSDPLRLESEAVRQFYSVYRDLSRETLDKGDEAQVALVVFSTLAQVVDWDGSGHPWLPVTDRNTASFTSAIERYLGGSGSDPRNGRDTDYLAALEEVKRLISGLQSPPAVLFLTDGRNEPHPLLSPQLPIEVRRGSHPELWQKNEQLLAHIADGTYRFLRPNGGPAAFDRKEAGVQTLALSADQEQSARDTVTASLTGLMQQRFFLSSRQPAVPLYWQPVFLGIEESTAARNLLVGSDARSSGGPSFIECRDGRELPGQFIGALSNWLRLSVRSVPRGASRLQVPSDTQAFALTLRTMSSGTRFDLRSATRHVSLSGRNGVWAGVAAGGGDWDLQTDAGTVERGSLYLTPRYEWVLHAPIRQVITHSNDPIRLDLYLLSLETGAPVAAERVYPNLPERLPVDLGPDEGQRQMQSTLVRSPGQTAAYSVSFTAPELRFGQMDVKVDLRPLAQAGITIPGPSLSQRIELRANLRVVVTTADGHPTSIAMRNVPREASRLHGIWERVHGRRN